MLSLSGIALQEEQYVQERSQLGSNLDDLQLKHGNEEIIEDLLDRVKTPEQPPPDLSNDNVFRREFEAKNKKHSLWYTPHAMNAFR